MQLIYMLLYSILLSSLVSPCLAAKREIPKHDVDVSAVETGSFTEHTSAPADYRDVRIVGFNIKYGLNTEGVTAYLKKQLEYPGALIICLSEVDRFHSRTGDRNIAQDLARELKMNYAFAVEFVEFTDATPENQGSSGNAILSRLPIGNPAVLRHTAAFDWNEEGSFTEAARDGGRSALIAEFEIAPGRKINVVSAHLENRATAKGRAMQMVEIVTALDVTKNVPAVIAGDLNEENGTLMFKNLKKAGFMNALENNKTPTGGCLFAKNGAANCVLKLDWILYRALKLVSAAPDEVVDKNGKLFSDHRPVRADFVFTE